MSSGKTHGRATLLLVAPVAIASVIIFPTDPLLSVIVGAVGCATGLIIDPDLDIESITMSEWRMIKKLSIFGMLWAALWYPYAVLIPHRSPLSHWPILGTAGRAAYIFLLAKFIAVIFGVSLPIMAIINQPVFVVWFFGLAMADTAHFVMDVISSRLKRKW